MRTHWVHLLAAATLLTGWAAVPLRGAAQCRLTSGQDPAAATAAAFQMRVVKLAWGTIASDHVELSATLELTASQTATVSHIQPVGLHVNGMPVYGALVAGPVHLEARRPLTLPPVELSVYYRDLTSLDPLADLVEHGEARFTGTIEMDARLNALEHLLLGSATVAVVSPISSQLPVATPGGLMVHAAMVAGLESAGRLWQAAAARANSARGWASRQRQQLQARYEPALLRIETRFAFAQPHGEPAAYQCTGLGFRLDGSSFVALKQTLEPWKFDAAMAFAMQRQKYQFEPGAYDVTVTPVLAASGAPDGSLNRGAIRILYMPPDQSHSLYMPAGSGRPQRIQVESADGAGNWALLAWTAPAAAAPEQARMAAGAATGWDELAGFRLGDAGAPELLLLAATRAGSRLELSAPVDASAWGSPLVGPDGVLAIIQSERGALLLAPALAAAQAHPGRGQ